MSAKSELNLSQNSFLISASQKVRVRLSFERVHDDQTDKGSTPSHASKAATSADLAERVPSLVVSLRAGCDGGSTKFKRDH